MKQTKIIHNLRLTRLLINNKSVDVSIKTYVQCLIVGWPSLLAASCRLSRLTAAARDNTNSHGDFYSTSFFTLFIAYYLMNHKTMIGK